MYTLTINGAAIEGEIAGLPDARLDAARRNEANPSEEVAIRLNGKVIEIWVEKVTFTATPDHSWIAYSAADIDSIGAARQAGHVIDVHSRGHHVGVFATFGEAALALESHARSPAYKSG